MEDTILIHEVVRIGPGKTAAISDDTDVFVLLLHFIFSGDIKANLLMHATFADSDKVIDITATYHKYISIMPNILTAHALSGCNTVGSYLGVGKPAVVKALKNITMSLASIGELNSPL